MSTEAHSLRAGDWVEVRSKEEILRTLDKRGQLDNMPFMPEMFEHCGRRFQVSASAHKTCDTISGTGGRSMPRVVHLQDLRCSGKAHGGCEAECLLYWKESWLKPVDGQGITAAATPTNGAAAPAPAASTSGAGDGCTEADVVAGTRGPSDGGVPTYVCQATELVRASKLLPWWDVRQYVEDYRTGNVDLKTIAVGAVYSAAANLIKAARNRPRIQAALIAAYDRVQAVRGGRPFPRKVGTIPAGQKTPPCQLDLQPGELVKVKSHPEILATLDTNNKNRGLYFDAEHVAYCDQTFRVHSRVNKIVDEKNGKMLEFKSGSIVLEGVVCKAQYSDRRMFCPRAIYPYWREAWLERVTPKAE
jgi:hypothetical protein